MQQGLLLFAHGARDPAWSRPFEQARDLVIARHAGPGQAVHVSLAFLEFMSPDMIEAGKHLVAQGCQAVTVVPLFLGAGGHVRKDLPLLITRLREAHPDVAWHLTPAVGESDLMIEALADATSHLAGLSP